MVWSSGDLLSGKYRLVRRLGAGAAAEAWEAENVLLGRTVAVKILHEHLAKDASVRAHFLAEARAAARIAHPNVVDVFDIGVSDGGTPFIVMELCNGETLSTVIDGRGPMGVSYAVDLVMQVLAALHSAHGLGIVHRDLKPDNLIVVHPRPDQPVVKVLDFGIAQGVFGDGHVHGDDGGQIFGTPEYMPPEQARAEMVDARADLYAAGVILYELLTGIVPFQGASPTEIIAKLLTRPALPPSRMNVTIPKELDRIVLSALAKVPAKRPQTAAEFMTEIAPFGTSAKPSLPALPSLFESEAPLPLVTERPSARQSFAPDSRPTLELMLDSNPPDIHPLLKRKA
ncbi:MAG TPA: serine/threonine-protein kinase [Polyangiaceae bacterium]|jgi:serine/threonine-protein kinase|nr:serine/threonine-protein kinase [Polyangiaceae bacterium]